MSFAGRLFAVLGILFFSLTALAAPKVARWTGAEDKNADLAHIVDRLDQRLGVDLKASDLQLFEDRDLANNHFKMYFQTAAGVPVRSRSVRVWTTLDTHETVQVEAYLDDPQVLKKMILTHSIMGLSMSPQIDTMELVRKAVDDNLRFSGDSQIRDVSWSDAWDGGTLVRIVKAKGHRGVHHVVLSLDAGKVLSTSYVQFPQADIERQVLRTVARSSSDEFNLPALIYPIYEETEGNNHLQTRARAELKYLKSNVARVTGDSYAGMRTRRYFESQMDPILGETEAGRANGSWAMSYIKKQASGIQATLPRSENSFTQGVILDGRYATINIHPNAAEKLKGLNFSLLASAQFKPDWRESTNSGNTINEMVPAASLLGRPLATDQDGLLRPARRLADHNPAEYLNDGFDELQVYYAINTLEDSLHGMGFTDPELSTRPFNAFLYDPDISMRDNAYYTDDTINFTTYSPQAQNFARDNSTIWHELGHGIMDRLMGDLITLADTGGLSEGMADFVAALVIADVTNSVPFEGSDRFRIINKTGFFLTNEVHDDGEAYGGAMKDLLDGAVARFGQAGVGKVAAVTMEAMRLCRNHPALTAQDWFAHMLFADRTGELHELILNALAGRNFSMDGSPAAALTLKNGNDEVTSTGLGSRSKPIPVTLPVDGKVTYHMTAALKSNDHYRFEYPVKVRVFLRGGPLQGAIHWDGEENTSLDYTLSSEATTLPFDLTANGKCDTVNREDGSCVDFAYVQIFNKGRDDKPVAKKRFYLRIKN